MVKPKKGKKGGAKKVKAKVTSGDGGESKETDFKPLVLMPETEDWVTLDLKLLNWHYLNFQMRVKITTRLFTIKNRLVERHGRITELRVCKDQFNERNEMSDDMMTLAEYGIQGAPKDAEPMVYQIYYDFKPSDHDDPLLLVMRST